MFARLQPKWLLLALLWLCLTGRASAEDRNVRVSEVRTGHGVYLIAELTHCSEATITLTASLDQMVASTPLPLTVDVTGQKRLILTVLTRSDPQVVGSYTWEYHWKYGRRPASAFPASVYSLPYNTGPFQVIQGPYGSFSHAVGSQDEEAIDWAMPIGTKVTAARSGTVIGFRADCSEGGADKKWMYDFNYVIIKHDDGTFAEYLHLRRGGVLVALGERVAQNQSIGLSGNTGYSSAPHLHFAVFVPLDGNTRQTLPVTFRSASGETFQPQLGQFY